VKAEISGTEKCDGRRPKLKRAGRQKFFCPSFFFLSPGLLTISSFCFVPFASFVVSPPFLGILGVPGGSKEPIPGAGGRWC
jgi:hypothetical protein